MIGQKFRNFWLHALCACTQ